MLGLALTNSLDCKTQDTFECRAFLSAPPETNGLNAMKTKHKNKTGTRQNKNRQHAKTS